METEKFYKIKRDEVKKEKRDMANMDFFSSKDRKKYRDGINRTYRAIKRKEKQDLKKYIDKEVDDYDTHEIDDIND